MVCDVVQEIGGHGKRWKAGRSTIATIPQSFVGLFINDLDPCDLDIIQYTHNSCPVVSTRLFASSPNNVQSLYQ